MDFHRHRGIGGYHRYSTLHRIAARRQSVQIQGSCIPHHGDGLTGTVAVIYRSGFGKGDRCGAIAARLHRKRRVVRTFHRFGGHRPGLHQFPDLQRSQRFAVEVKHCLVVHGRAAVPFSGVVGVIFSRIGGCPAGAVLFPGKAVGSHLRIVDFPFQAGNIVHRLPCRFPVEQADAVLPYCSYGAGHVGHLRCLALDRECPVFTAHIAVIVGTDPHGVVMAVAVLQRSCPGSLGHHDLLAVGIGHLLQHSGQVVQRAMPVGVVGGSKHVVVHVMVRQLLGVSRIAACCFRIGEMDSRQNGGIIFSRHRMGSIHTGRKQLGGSVPAVGSIHHTGNAVIGFVADLHHAHVDPCIQQRAQAFGGKSRNRSSLFVHRHILPRLGRLLFARIGPEVRIVEIDKDLHSCLGGPPAYPSGSFQVIVATAVAMPLGIIGVVPDPQAHPVHPRVGQLGHKGLSLGFHGVSQRVTVRIPEHYPAVEQREQ